MKSILFGSFFLLLCFSETSLAQSDAFGQPSNNVGGIIYNSQNEDLPAGVVPITSDTSATGIGGDTNTIYNTNISNSVSNTSINNQGATGNSVGGPLPVDTSSLSTMCESAKKAAISSCNGTDGSSAAATLKQALVGTLIGVAPAALSECGINGAQAGNLGSSMNTLTGNCTKMAMDCDNKCSTANTNEKATATKLARLITQKLSTDDATNLKNRSEDAGERANQDLVWKGECDSAALKVSAFNTGTAAQLTGAMASSAVCRNLLAANNGACGTDAGATNPACTSNFCAVSAQTPYCPSYNSQCTGANAGNASGSTCQGLANLIAGLDKSGNLSDSGLGDETNPGYGGYAASQNKAAGFEASGAGGGGGGGLGGGAPAGGAGAAPSGGAGGSASNFKTDIGGGFSGGAGGGYGGIGMGSMNNGAGGYGGNASNLGQYLPGGAMDPNRKPASDDLAAKGISCANNQTNFQCLTNFQKISILMNKKRTTLLKPAEGS